MKSPYLRVTAAAFAVLLVAAPAAAQPYVYVVTATGVGRELTP